jgi:hypothetical protein
VRSAINQIFLVACLGAVCLHAAAGPEQFLFKLEAAGVAHGTGLHARQRAIQAAQEQALRELAESLVGRDSPRIVEVLVEQGAAFIHTSNVAQHEVVHGETRVQAAFLVNILRFRRVASQLLLPELPYKPHVLIVVADLLDPAEAPPGSRIAETTLADAFRDAGLEVADAGDVRAQYPPQALETLLAEADSGDLIGRNVRCDVAILGTVTAARAGRGGGGNVLPTTAHLVLRVVRSSDGRLLDSAAIEAIVNSVDYLEGATQAIEDASRKLAPQMIDAAVLAVVDPDAPGGITLTIEAPATRANFEVVRQALQDHLDPDAVQEVFYSDELARLRLDYAGDLRQIVRPLVTRRYPGFHLEQRQTYGRQSVLRLHAE